ncbi:MAG: DUF3108 domain-containing protein [Acidobacteria bacterium]|nr:DUF3108 domain-containing protein [Acidobacteriota bacterium]MBI3654941.1 DUF3108 domain-containing protein [Acidobacteriota bacterium]
MKVLLRFIIILTLALCLATRGFLCLQAADPTGAPFYAGETLVYEIKWDPPRWLIFLPATYTAGLLTLRMEEMSKERGATAYRLSADVLSSGILPKIAMISVRDHFEAWVDAQSHCLLRSAKQIREGKRKRDYEAVIMGAERKAHVRETDVATRTPQEKKNKDLLNIPACVQDLLSALFVIRANRFAESDIYTMDILDEDRIKTIQVRVLKKEKILLKSRWVPAVKVQTVSLFGGLFKTGGSLLVWVSDDDHKIPLKFDAQVKYGHVFGFLKTRSLSSQTSLP